MLQLYNTLTQKVEPFTPLDPKVVTVYCCGPTVYDFATIANFRTYSMTDFLVRTLRYIGYQTKYVMNITDVGHMTSDSDTGEDKMEKGAHREGKTAWDVARFYTDAFLSDSKKLHLLEPDVRPKPTEHIKEQIHMVHMLLEKGFAYKISDGIYFDTSRFPSYGALTSQRKEEMKAGARVEINPQKRNPTDFALWKFSPPPAGGKKRDMEWDSPWGKGFPGWHIECSSLSSKYLGKQIDIHTGGADLIPIHHTNEIAQSEAAYGVHPFVRYWVHGQFMLVDGGKMSKSKHNFYTVSDLENKGFDPLALRYFYCSAHYRTFLNFTFTALTASQNALRDLRLMVGGWRESNRTQVSLEKIEKIDGFRKRFTQAVENDLNIPGALSIVWEMAKSNIPSPDKYDLIIDFDQVLGLKLSDSQKTENREQKTPEEITFLINKRDNLRKEKKYEEADDIRKQIELKLSGYIVEDTAKGTVLKKK